MCGIWGTLNAACSTDTAVNALRTLGARGPEGAKVEDISGIGIIGFTRLAINGLSDEGMQPMQHDGLICVTNGEIYNWRELAAENGLSCTTGSDCEVIGKLCKKLSAAEVFRSLDGVFATAIYDSVQRTLILARDPYGVRPLFKGWDKDGNLYFGSELKSLTGCCTIVEPVEPGIFEIYDAENSHFMHSEQYHKVSFTKIPSLADEAGATAAVRLALETAVKKRMMTERPVAALLSGGLDSSLIAALVAKELRAVGAEPLNTFSIGMAGSKDLEYARKVSNWIGSKHHEIVVTAADMLDAIPAVIKDIESYDTTTVRASVGNWLVAREVERQSGCKVVFNGDGSDEVFGSYLYFYNAPSAAEYETEVKRLLDDINTFDVLRSDRSISSHGLEPRTPFLDKAFVQTVLSSATALRRPIRGGRVEKWLLREAFRATGLLPDEVLWRRKEAFSDGVSGTEKSWYEVVQEFCSKQVPGDWSEEAKKWTVNTPATAEQFYYRSIFEGLYGGHSLATVPYFWMPKWCEGATDPSARTLKVYAETT